jgi:hypothetical protein
VPGSQLSIDPASYRFKTALANEWNHLEPDKYLKDGARFRERRYDCFYYQPRINSIRLQPHRPYFQSADVNEYAGGVKREVAPLTMSTLENPLLKSLILFNFAQLPIDDELLDRTWEVQCHQFRIIGTPAEPGEPTPEGPHRDEIDFGAIHLVSRSNANGGKSQVFSNEKKLITEFCLTSAMDTMFWADQQILHAATPITAEDGDRPAVRDILIIGYKWETCGARI